jgi:hypothetical protein
LPQRSPYSLRDRAKNVIYKDTDENEEEEEKEIIEGEVSLKHQKGNSNSRKDIIIPLNKQQHAYDLGSTIIKM